LIADPDGELVARIARGDQGAARELIDRHLPKMLSLARRLLGNQTDAEDVTQDVFLKVWINAPSWRPGGAKFETWMHRVAMNLCYDRLRKRRPVALDEIEEPVDEGPAPGTALTEADISDAVDQALSRLPERQRAAVVLCHYQGLTNIEAAKALEVSVEALESLLARGRRTLRTALKTKLSDLLGET
jgi:RNA polymerase sigma-70 factor (ECF subfamily)